MVDTRAGFWLQVATVALTVAAVAPARSSATPRTTRSRPSSTRAAARGVLLPVAGVLLVTSEWSQRTGMITFSLVPVRSRVLVAKLAASLVLAVAPLACSRRRRRRACSSRHPASTALVGCRDADRPVRPSTSVAMLTGVAFGASCSPRRRRSSRSSRCPCVPALASLSVFAGVAPWLDTDAFGPLAEEVMSADQWAHAGTAMLLWLALPLAIGAYRISGREVFGSRPGCG